MKHTRGIPAMLLQRNRTAPGDRAKGTQKAFRMLLIHQYVKRQTMNALLHFSRPSPVFLSILLLTASHSQAATFHVAKGGSDSNNGSPSTPFLTVMKGVNTAVPGDTVRIGPGIYEEVVSTVRPGLSNSPIILDGQSGATIRQLFFKHSFVVVQNMTISGTHPMFSRLVYFDFGAHSCIMSNNILDALGAHKVFGIQWRLSTVSPFGNGEVASDALIVSNTIRNLSGYVFVMLGGDRNVIRGNFLRDGPQGDFFNVFGRNHLIAGNICSNMPFAEGLGNHPDFIQTWGNNGQASSGHIIENNIVTDIAGGQLTQLEGNLLPQTRDWTFRNNLFSRIALQASCTIPDVRYINNVFYQCNKTNGGHALVFGTRFYDKVGVFNGGTGTNAAHGTVLLNNVFLDCGDGPAPEKGWYAIQSNLTNVVANFNYVGKAGFAPVKVDAQRRAVGSPGGWSSFDWWEPNGINGGDPKFVDLIRRDFRIGDTSLLVARGTTSPLVTRDFLGRPRPSTPAIGAFESSQATIPAQPTGLRIVPPEP